MSDLVGNPEDRFSRVEACASESSFKHEPDHDKRVSEEGWTS